MFFLEFPTGKPSVQQSEESDFTYPGVREKGNIVLNLVWHVHLNLNSLTLCQS